MDGLFANIRVLQGASCRSLIVYAYCSHLVNGMYSSSNRALIFLDQEPSEPGSEQFDHCTNSVFLTDTWYHGSNCSLTWNKWFLPAWTPAHRTWPWLSCNLQKHVVSLNIIISARSTLYQGSAGTQWTALAIDSFMNRLVLVHRKPEIKNSAKCPLVHRCFREKITTLASSDSYRDPNRTEFSLIFPRSSFLAAALVQMVYKCTTGGLVRPALLVFITDMKRASSHSLGPTSTSTNVSELPTEQFSKTERLLVPMALVHWFARSPHLHW